MLLLIGNVSNGFTNGVDWLQMASIGFKWRRLVSNGVDWFQMASIGLKYVPDLPPKKTI